MRVFSEAISFENAQGIASEKTLTMTIRETIFRLLSINTEKGTFQTFSEIILSLVKYI
ncbi:MAG: hypothetical protein JETT_1628 [Candidatus Jettenia ecosi]|uniref:Uncharacterized protein n=1 Tax=Candidatus Jettenia ecosi TaxID=2494326 RepID=A0A533QBQ8_9BACT|nr:MAG: hypothetical protein JETT_1628 [Candidatus Jettenia ecosi]